MSKTLATAIAVTVVGLSVGAAIVSGGIRIEQPAARAQETAPILTIEPKPLTFIFMQVKVMDHEKLANEKFFIGRLPEPGEARRNGLHRQRGRRRDEFSVAGTAMRLITRRKNQHDGPPLKST